MKDPIIIYADYIGSVLSVNRCWIVRAGRRTNTLRKEVKEWRDKLSVLASLYKGQLEPPVFIRFSANFKDHRHPDMDNLRKVTCDGLKVGLGIDDKYFLTLDGDVQVNPNIPAQLVLEIWDRTCGNPPVDIYLEPLTKSKLEELARLSEMPNLGG